MLLKCTLTELDRSIWVQDVEAPRISRQTVHESGKVVSTTHRPPLLISVRGCVDSIAAGKIKSMENSSDPIGNRTRELSACSAVPQPTASPRACIVIKIRFMVTSFSMDGRTDGRMN